MADTNIFTQAGEEWVVDQLDAVAGTRYIGWGTGGSTAAKGNTALVTPASEARQAATESQPAADKIRYVATITADGTKGIDEAGAFSAISGGTMILSSTFTEQPVVLNDTIEFTFTLEFT